MKYSKEELNLENGLKKEWLVTIRAFNRMGRRKSSCCAGTRKIIRGS